MNELGDCVTFETRCVAEWCELVLLPARQPQRLRALRQRVRARLLADMKTDTAQATCDAIERLVRGAMEGEYDPDASLTITSLMEKCLRHVDWSHIVDALWPLVLEATDPNDSASNVMQEGFDDDDE